MWVETHAAEFKPALQQLRWLVCPTLPRVVRFVTRLKRSSSDIPQTGTNLFLSSSICCVCVCVRVRVCMCVCASGQWGHSCWRGANVMRMFTRLQVTVPLTLPGRSATFAQSLHLTPNTHAHAQRWSAREHAPSLLYSSLSFSFFWPVGSVEMKERYSGDGVKAVFALIFISPSPFGDHRSLRLSTRWCKMVKLSLNSCTSVSLHPGSVCLCICMLGDGA